jgi:hypothetical protein
MADYSPNTSSAVDAPETDDNAALYFDIGQLKRQYGDYFGVKNPEIEEQKEARRYYHGAQWTDKEIKKLKARRQPVITSNRIVRKVDAVVGLVERLRQDPKAFPRNPGSQQGADLATAVLRYALDHVDWRSKSPRCARMAAIDGIAGIELDLAYGDHGDPDIDLHIVYSDTYFYDPRSYDDGFTDRRFEGVSKWVDVEQAKELVPEKAQEIDDLIETGTDVTQNSDREITWVNTSAKKVRLVDHWYINKGKWFWCLYIGNSKLMEGVSPYLDERNRSFSKYLMFSASVDHDGDRYGFIRNLKSPQDEINHRRSKALHLLNSTKVQAEKGAVADVEKARAELARSDTWLETNPNKKIELLDRTQDFKGQMEFLQEAKTEIENFGPNPALIGQGIEGSSGRAISLLQQAGIAELGPYILAYRAWKIRVYRAIWNIVQKYWTAERWIRVTDDQNLAQFFQINQLSTDQYGHPAIVNAIGSLDVDIILDEGPDTITMMEDVFDTLKAIIPTVAPMLSPAAAAAALGLLIETAPLPEAAKQQFKKAQEQPPDPAQTAAKQVALAGEQAKVQKTKADTFKGFADGMKTLHDAHIDSQTFSQQLAPPVPPQGAPVQQQQPMPQLPPQGSFGPMPGVQSPSADVPTLQQQPIQPPGQIPAGALAR